MLSIANVSGSKQAAILISIIMIISIVDSQFVNTFYGTDLDIPSNRHLLLFISFVIIISVINLMLLLFIKRNGLLSRTNRLSLLKTTFRITSKCISELSQDLVNTVNRSHSLLVSNFTWFIVVYIDTMA